MLFADEGETLVNWIPSFLGIPRNSQKFPTMQISSYLKSSELLGISGKGWLQFWEDLEFLGISRNSRGCPGVPVHGGIPIVFISTHGVVTQFVNVSFLCVPVHEDTTEFSAIQTTNNLRRVEFLGTSGNWIWGNLNILRSKLIPRNSQYLECEGFKKRSNFRGLKLWLNKRCAVQNLPRDIHTWDHVYYRWPWSTYRPMYRPICRPRPPIVHMIPYMYMFIT